VATLSRRATPMSVIGLAVVLLLLLSEFVVTHNFLQLGSLSVLTPLIGIMVIVATGQAFVMGTGGIDLSVAAVISLVGSIVLKQSLQRSDRLVGALLLCLAACVVVGLVNGVLIEALRLNALVVTLAVGQLVAGFTRLYRGDVLAITNVPKNLSQVAGAGVGGVSYLLLVSVIIAVLAALFLQRCVAGRRLVASSAAPGTASLAGLRASGYRILAYVLASCAYGVGGVLAAGQLGTPDLTLGDPYLLTSVVAVVLGGAALTGGRVSPVSTLLGAVFITVLDYDLRVRGYPAGVRLMAQGVVLVLALSLGFGLQYLPRIGQLLARTAPGGLDAVDGTNATH
jgi:ribose transport system permease protein